MTEIFQLQTFNQAEASVTFEKLKVQLQSILAAGVDIEHIGATAIPGCITKGDLDICVRVEQKDFNVCDSVLAKNFARNTGSTRTEYFSSFHTANIGIQLVVINSDLDVFVKFRELLIQNPKLLTEYNNLKLKYNGQPMEKYRKAKDAFIEAALA